MNKDKLFLLSVMLFYIVAGVLTCAFFFFRSSSLSGNEAPSLSALYDIKPELFRSVLPETTETPLEAADAPQEAADALPEVSDAVSETDPVETTPEPVYYAFTTLNNVISLNVRQEPSLDAPIIARFSPGTTGYVLEQGSAWSLVRSGDITGYVSNEYLNFREIPKEEYPAP
ncbi:MAG: SH3 domain-containing protein [Acetatifactor sp.]|nr:SH3 domain-containing protein [Acetatifactor sp.]